MNWPTTMPPRGYIAEKIGGSLLAIHTLYQDIVRYVPEGLQHPSTSVPFSIKHDALLAETFTAFRYQLTGYLSLIDRTTLASDQGLFQRLLDMPQKDFQAWLRALNEAVN